MNVDEIFQPQGPGANQVHTTSPAHAAASVQGGPILPAEQRLHAGLPSFATLSTFAAPDQHAPMAIKTESNKVRMYGSSKTQPRTIMDQKGHHFEIPVNVEAASTAASEKRKRNAGALARFRARRKKKERESTATMERQKWEISKALESVDYYRAERDYFRSVVLQLPNAEQYLARPPSPQLSFTPSNAPSTKTGAGSTGSPYSEPLNSPGSPAIFTLPPLRLFNQLQQRPISEPRYIGFHAP